MSCPTRLPRRPPPPCQVSPGDKRHWCIHTPPRQQGPGPHTELLAHAVHRSPRHLGGAGAAPRMSRKRLTRGAQGAGRGCSPRRAPALRPGSRSHTQGHGAALPTHVSPRHSRVTPALTTSQGGGQTKAEAAAAAAAQRPPL